MNKLKFCLILAKADDTFAAENKNNNKMEQVNQKTKKDKTVTLFDRIDARTVESSIMGIWKICLEDQQYKEASIKWATENGVSISEIPLTPITFMLSTPGGNCYDGLALYDTIANSSTPVEIICSGKVMSMGVITLLAADIRKSYRNTTFMIHQVSGMNFGTLQDMKESVEESERVNSLLFDIIQKKSKVTKERLDEVAKQKEDWFFSAEEALDMGIITEII